MLVLLGLAVTVFVFVSIDILSFALKRKGWDRFLSTFLLSFAQIILVLFTLGLTSLLITPAVILLSMIVSSLIVIMTIRKYGKRIFSDYWRNARTNIAKVKKDLRSDILWALLVFLASLLLAWIIFLGVIFPATDFDGNSYHLTFIGYVVQNQNFFDVPTSLGWLTGYPKGGEFIQLWQVLVTGRDLFTDLAQVPFLILGVYALYVIACRLGVDKRQARFVALLFLFLPIVLNQLKTTYIDVMLCSLFFTAIAVVIKDKMLKLDYVLLGIVYSLLISLKFTGFLFVAATVPFLFWSLHRNRIKRKRRLLQSYVWPLALVAAPTIFGFYWYVKNAVLYGTPLHPFGLKLAGVTIFPGKTFQDLADGAISTLKDLPSGCVERVWFVWTEQKDWYGCLYNYDANFTGMGPIWFIILLPAILVSIYLIIKQKNYLYVAIITVMAVVFAVYPINYYSRYTMFIAAIGIISLGLILTHIRPNVGNAVKLVAIVLAGSVIYMNIALCNFTPGVIKVQLQGGDLAEGSAFHNNFGASHVFIRRVVQPGEVVAYDSSPYFIYPLWNEDFSNEVIYVPAKTEDEWARGLIDKRVKYVFTTIGSREDEWLRANGAYKSIYKDSLHEVYKIY